MRVSSMFLCWATVLVFIPILLIGVVMESALIYLLGFGGIVLDLTYVTFREVSSWPSKTGMFAALSVEVALLLVVALLFFCRGRVWLRGKLIGLLRAFAGNITGITPPDPTEKVHLMSDLTLREEDEEAAAAAAMPA